MENFSSSYIVTSRFDEKITVYKAIFHQIAKLTPGFDEKIFIILLFLALPDEKSNLIKLIGMPTLIETGTL